MVWKLALATLNDGRLSIPAIAAAAGEELTEFSARWAKTRSQWGKKIGLHENGSDKLALNCCWYLCDAFSIRLLCCSVRCWR